MCYEFIEGFSTSTLCSLCKLQIRQNDPAIISKCEKCLKPLLIAKGKMHLCRKAPNEPGWGCASTKIAMQKTIVLLKPDVFERCVFGTILSYFDQKGLEISSCAFFPRVTKEMMADHYRDIQDKPYFQKNLEFVTRGPIFYICFIGEDAIAKALEIRNQVRQDNTTDLTENLIHASDSVESAARENKLWIRYAARHANERK